WRSCSSSALAHYQCATVAVPRDPKNPSAGTISMTIDRRRATGPKIGSLLVNPGGPGVSGVDSLPTLVAPMPASLLDRFDVVGFDPPGVARTEPIICLDSSGLQAYYHVDPEPTNQAAFNALVQADRTFDSGCQSRSGSELPYVSTADAAMDMDVLRQDLGDAKLTSLGFSYGTLLGATYANLFPEHVRAMVLDGALDPALGVISSLDEQAAGLDGQLRQFFASCKPATCLWKPSGDMMAAYQALLARARANPLKVSGTTRTVGPAEFLYGTAVTLYSTTTWQDLAYALQAASQGDGGPFLQYFDTYTGRQADGSYNNLFEANAAINCADTPAPSLSQLQAALPAAEAAAPVFGSQNLYSEITCSEWPIPASGKIGALRAAGAAPIVVVGSTGDPITPYRWAQSLASELQSGVLVTRVGDGHTGYRSSSCVRAAVDSYLTDLTVPATGTSCPSD
ncbi:MAG TPA: alpha/beta hydrolase, partial [Acidimicrobiales bacterium]|nr:alpha/beta hydrolase [Acidimicrobiales bacterium]